MRPATRPEVRPEAEVDRFDGYLPVDSGNALFSLLASLAILAIIVVARYFS